jgi:hypothetical protein
MLTTSSLSCLDSRVAALLDLYVLLKLLKETNHLRIVPDLVLLGIGQFVRRLLVVFRLADSLYEIVASRRTKIDGESVTVDEVQYVVSLVDVPAITNDLSALFGVKASAVDDR